MERISAKSKFRTKMGMNRTLVRDFKNQRITDVIGGQHCKFRSKLEYNWARWCQLRKEQGLIVDWKYEDPELCLFRFTDEKCGAVKYLCDFVILHENGELTFEECKGYLSGRDRSKFRKVQKYYPGTKLDLVLQRVPKKQTHGIRIAEKYCNRIVDASKIFKQLGYA